MTNEGRDSKVILPVLPVQI